MFQHVSTENICVGTTRFVLVQPLKQQHIFWKTLTESYSIMVWEMPNLLKVSGTQVHEKSKPCHLTSYSDSSDIDSCHLCSVTKNYTMAHDVPPKNHHFTCILRGFITYLWLRNAWEWKGRCQSLSGLWEICEFFGKKSTEQSLNVVEHNLTVQMISEFCITLWQFDMQWRTRVGCEDYSEYIHVWSRLHFFLCLRQDPSARCHSKGPFKIELNHPGVLGDFSSPVPSTRNPHWRPAVSCADVQL